MFEGSNSKTTFAKTIGSSLAFECSVQNNKWLNVDIAFRRLKKMSTEQLDGCLRYNELLLGNK